MSRRRDQPHETPSNGGRPPPHDLAAEAACLSAMMLKPDAVHEVRNELEALDFWSEANRTICEACFDLADRGDAIDVVTVAARLREVQKLQQVGGAAYLAEMVDATPAVWNVKNHARIVHGRAVLRRKIDGMQVAQAFLYGVPDEEVAGHVEAAQAALDEPMFRNVESTRASLGVALAAGVDQLIENQRQAAANGGTGILGVSTGVASLDALTGGFHESETVFASGPTGNGKTSGAAQMGLHVGRTSAENHPTKLRSDGTPKRVRHGVAIFTLEMPREEYALKMACSYGRVDFQALRTGAGTLEDWTRLRAAQVELNELPIEIDDATKLTPRELERQLVKIRREMASRGHEQDADEVRLRLVIVDQIQLMAPSDAPSKQSTDEQTFFNIGRDLRAISQTAAGKRETLMILSQENGKGQLARCSALKQHAVTWLGFKVDKTESDHAWRSKRYGAEITIRKQRFGSFPESIPMWFEGPFTRFEDGQATQAALPSNVVPMRSRKPATSPAAAHAESDHDDEIQLGSDGMPL